MISAQSAIRRASGRHAFGSRPAAIAINPAIARIASGVQKKNPCSGDNSTCNPCGAYQYIFRVDVLRRTRIPVQPVVSNQLRQITKEEPREPRPRRRKPSRSGLLRSLGSALEVWS